MRPIHVLFAIFSVFSSLSALEVPRMVLADGYTIAANEHTCDEAIEKSVYHIYFRRPQTEWMKEMGIPREEARYIFYGLRRIIDRVIAPPVTQAEIDAADAFFTKHNFPWPKEVWQRVVTENNGQIPIKIEALPEGSVVFPGEPVIQTTAEDGFGDLSAWFESTFLQVWAPSERASLLRYLLEYNKSVVEDSLEEGEVIDEAELIARAQRMMADMGARSCRGTDDMLDLGLASMLSLGGATPGSVFLANEGESSPVGSLAGYSLAHRVVQGFEEEGTAYTRLYEFIKARGWHEGSFVADCYDYRNAVKTHLLPLAKRGLNDGITIYARPDSGDLYDQVVFVLNLAKEHGLYRTITTQSGTKLIGMTSLKVIQADGMSYRNMKMINKRLIDAGYSPAHCVAYGVGGALQKISRDSLSAAQKLAAVGKNDRPVMKIAVPAKESIPGVVKIVRPGDRSPTVRWLSDAGDNEYVVYYAPDGSEHYREPFTKIQERVLYEFDQVKPSHLLSEQIEKTKSELRAKYGTKKDHQ